MSKPTQYDWYHSDKHTNKATGMVYIKWRGNYWFKTSINTFNKSGALGGFTRLDETKILNYSLLDGKYSV